MGTGIREHKKIGNEERSYLVNILDITCTNESDGLLVLGSGGKELQYYLSDLSSLPCVEFFKSGLNLLFSEFDGTWDYANVKNKI